MANVFGRNNDGKGRQSLATPRTLFSKIREFVMTEYGDDIVFDVAATSRTSVTSGFYSPQNDALSNSLSWSKEGYVWCNPPFSEARAWTSKAIREVYRGAKVVMLVSAGDIQVAWWRENARFADVYILSPRVRYVDVSTEKMCNNAPFPSALWVVNHDTFSRYEMNRDESLTIKYKVFGTVNVEEEEKIWRESK